MSLKSKTISTLIRSHSWKSFFILNCIFILAACSPPPVILEPPSSTPTPIFTTEVPTQETNTPEVEPTDPPIQSTIISSPTPTINVYDKSVLTLSQRQALSLVSLDYIADTEDEGIAIAGELGYTTYGHPETVCGPLVIGILRDARLLNKYINIKEFWLLNPRDEFTINTILEKNFPSEDYLWFRTETSLDKFDFNEFPLYTGDFLYLYAGPQGTFEHMLVITRIDEVGRIYSVTNFLSEDNGYLISEFLLYDPNNPGEGYFYKLADRSKSSGTTGFGGFQLWRPITPISEPAPADLEFAEKLDQVLEKYGGLWNILIKEVNGKIVYSRRVNDIIHPASTLKIPIAMLVFKVLEDVPAEDLRIYLSTHNIGGDSNGRTLEQLLHAMLVQSEEGATESLISWINKNINVDNVLDSWGAPFTSLDPRWSTIQEISHLFEELYLGNLLNSEARAIILEFLSEYTENDDSLLGVLSELLPDNSTIYNKRGTIYYERVIVADVAIIETMDESYLISMYAYPETDEPYPPFEELRDAIEEAAPLIWEHLNK